ncbi:hypothetical protein [Neptuniibacter sp. QD37_11]|uniref:hypothetical protein n=1 Tax=Neptuniibacter sp. QD37_11 TaxID=3398209 RepID=UPI0039F5C989
MKIGVLPNEGAKKPYRTIKITGLKPFLALTSNFVETGFYDHLVESFTDANGYDCMFEPTEVTMAALSQAE